MFRQYGDTVLVREIKYIDRILRDTVRITDTLSVTKTEIQTKTEKKTDWTKTIKYSLLGAMVISVLAMLIKKKIRR